MDVIGRAKIKAKVNEVTNKISYRIVQTAKNQTGETIFASMFVNFVGEAKYKPVDNDQYINIKKGFLSFRNDAEGKTVWNLVIQDFDYEEGNNTEFNPIDMDDDLPF